MYTCTKLPNMEGKGAPASSRPVPSGPTGRPKIRCM